MLYRFINYKIPALAPSLTFTQQLIPKVGSNLITDWTDTDMVGYSDHGSNRVTFNHSGANYGHCYSNQFAVTKGKLYCLILKTGTIAGAGIADLTTWAAVVPYYLSTVSMPGLGRYILFGVSDFATCTLVIQCKSGVTTTWTSVDVELYELDPCDWYVPYDIMWAEVWEDATGVISVNYDGTIMENKTGNILFKAPGLTSAEFIADYILEHSLQHFLNPDTYLNPEFPKSQIVNKNVPSGQGSYNVWIGVLERNVINVQGAAYYYNSAKNYLNSDIISEAPSYHPIMALAIGNTAFSTTRHYAYISLYSTIAVSADHHSVLNLKTYPRLIELMWLNQYGGFTSLCLSDSITERHISERTDYEIPSDTYIKRRVAKAKKYWLVEAESAVLNPATPDGIADLILSEYVLYSKEAGVWKEVYIRDKEILLADNGNINKIRITFEYAD
jgi:hypothetical protein